MSLLTKIAEVINVLNELKALKVALGFSEDASVSDIIAEVKAAGEALAGVTPTAAAPVAEEPAAE